MYIGVPPKSGTPKSKAADFFIQGWHHGKPKLDENYCSDLLGPDPLCVAKKSHSISILAVYTPITLLGQIPHCFHSIIVKSPAFFRWHQFCLFSITLLVKSDESIPHRIRGIPITKWWNPPIFLASSATKTATKTCNENPVSVSFKVFTRARLTASRTSCWRCSSFGQNPIAGICGW